MSKIILPAALILLLLTSCESLTMLNQTANVSDGDGQGSVPVDGTWAKINTEKVEEICTAEAKKAAGDNAWAVRYCTCTELVSNDMKQYYCDVFTVDPSGTEYFVKISCYLAGQTCTIQSNIGTETVTFEQLEEMYG